MPSVYAHYRFGCDVYELLPKKPKALVDTYRDLFDLGLQGPDILFFYRPVYYNYVNQLGRNLHHKPGGPFFQNAIELVRHRQHKGASMAYLCGTACHFALDLICHPYVEKIVAEKGLNHSAIEGALERALIIEDNHPLNFLVTGSIKPSPLNATVISQFYPRVTPKQVYQSLKIMIWCNDGLRMKDHLFKKSLFFILRLVGKYDSIAGMVITPEPKPEFAESDQELRRLFDSAKPVALELIQSLFSGVRTGEFNSPYFHHTYMG